MSKFHLIAHNSELIFKSDSHRAVFRQHLKNYENSEFSVERVKPTRSNNQNALLWFYLGIIATETGNNEDDLHEYFKRKFLPPRFVTVLKQEIKLPSSTTELSKNEFGDYLDKICALTNVPIPDTVAFKAYYDTAPRINE